MPRLISEEERDLFKVFCEGQDRLFLVDKRVELVEDIEKYRNKVTNALLAKAIIETELRRRRRNNG